MNAIDVNANVARPGTWSAEIERCAAPNAKQRMFASWLVDILVYVVVLNLYVEYSAAVVDSFAVSVLTAVLLKILLNVLMSAKSVVWRWARAQNGTIYTVVGALGVWVIVFFSKFGILAAEDFVFGDRVDLGSFMDIVLLVAALTLAREIVQRTYRWLGRPRPVGSRGVGAGPDQPTC